MLEIKLGNRYAKSIYGLALEKGSVEAVKKDFELIRTVCKQNPDFYILLKSPVVFADKKQKVVDAVFQGKLSKITDELIKIIIRKGREAYLPDIAQCFLNQYDIINSIQRGVLVSAAPLNPEFVQKIKSFVEKELNTSFFIEEKTDPSLIGGFVLRVGDRLFDGSVSGKLEQLRQEFGKNEYIAKVQV